MRSSNVGRRIAAAAIAVVLAPIATEAQQYPFIDVANELFGDKRETR